MRATEQPMEQERHVEFCWAADRLECQATASLAAFHKLYPGNSGKSADIEHALVHDWSKDPWAGMCEHISYRPGELGPFWPEVPRPLGRVHFAGAYAAQMSWGQKAELESANRVVSEIDKA